MESNNNKDNNDNIRPPDRVFIEKLIDDENNHINNYNLLHYNPHPNKPYNGLPKLKRHITNTWTIKKMDDNRFLSVPLFNEEDGEEDESKDINWLHDSSIQNNSNNNDNITLGDYDLEKAIQESFNQYNLENKNSTSNCLESYFLEEEIIPQVEEINLLPIFKSNIQRLIYFDKELKEIY